jgi:hypothetical protein
MVNNEQNILSDPILNRLRSSLSAAFYQTWDLDEEGGVQGVVDRQFNYTPEASEQAIESVNRLLKLISEMPEISSLLDNFSGDYDPSYDGLEMIEWLVLLKSYLQGNNGAFNNIT